MIMSQNASAVDGVLLQGRPGPLLLVGPAYSGKSAWSLQALRPQTATAVIGTAPLSDDPLMLERLAVLKALHPPGSLLVEHVSSLASTLRDVRDKGFKQILLDSVSHWIPAMVLSLGAKYDLDQMRTILMRELDEFTSVVTDLSARASVRLVLVSAETGASVVPREPASRFVRHMVGIFNQQLAQRCTDVFYITCGIPVWIKAG